MALDLTLCVVPKQIEALFLKAANNPDYGEWMQFIPTILKDPNGIDYQDEALIQLKKDMAALLGSHQSLADHHFYDSYRHFSTVDYLLDKHIRATNSDLSPSLLLGRRDQLS